MMKKLLSFFILGFAYVSLQAQPCTPGPETAPGIYPDTLTNLPTAYVNQAYFGTITAVIPPDTVVSGFTLIIDSIGIIGIDGLPTGFIYTPSSTSGYWAGGTKGCVAITGTPTLAQVGTYVLLLHAKAYVGGLPSTYDVKGYKITVIDTTSSLAENAIGKFELMQNMPNPFDYSTEIRFNSPSAGKYDFSVCNILGEVVFQSKVNAVVGINSIPFNGKDLKSGLYMYKLSNGSQTSTKRMTIE